MSLQVWLPLTKDLRNQGLSNTTATNSGATYSSTGGKLGGCYSFDGTDDAIGIGNLSTIVDTDFSWSCWFYRSEWSSKSWETIFGGPSGFELETKNGSTNSPLMYAYSWGRGTFTYELNQWNHLVMTRTTSETKFYLNGELKLTGSAGSIPSGNYFVGSWSSTTGQNFKGKVNDVRIYNHCLSPTEIKWLSQGLVLHYPLNANSTYTSLIDANAGYNIYNNFGSDVTTSLTATGEMFMGVPVRRLTMTIKNSSRVSSFKNDLWSHGVYNWSRTFLANTKYCFWIYYKPVTHTDIRVGGTASNISGWTEIAPEYVGDGWYRVGQYRNGSVTVDKTDNIFVSFTWASAAIDTPISIDFAYPTLVQGLTEIQPSINYNSGNKIYDCSGFCNNADVIGTWNTTNNTPKYQCCMHMSATTSKIHISNFPTSGFGNSYSFAWWGKRSSNSPMFWGFSDGIRLNGMYVGYLWNTGDGSNNPIYVPGTTTTITAPSVNVWHHYVMTGDGTTCKLYVDGVLYGQAKTYKAISGTSIWINGWDSSTSYCSDNTDMSDFRIYATALSASDVKSLYQNCATIDPDGTIRGQIRS